MLREEDRRNMPQPDKLKITCDGFTWQLRAMWLEEDISGFFSLFELKKEVLDSLLSQKYSKNDLDQFSEIEYQNILRDDVATARIMHMLWNHFCSYRHCAKDALVAVKETMVRHSDLLLTVVDHLESFLSKKFFC